MKDYSSIYASTFTLGQTKLVEVLKLNAKENPPAFKHSGQKGKANQRSNNLPCTARSRTDKVLAWELVGVSFLLPLFGLRIFLEKRQAGFQLVQSVQARGKQTQKLPTINSAFFLLISI